MLLLFVVVVVVICYWVVHRIGMKGRSPTTTLSKLIRAASDMADAYNSQYVYDDHDDDDEKDS